MIGSKGFKPAATISDQPFSFTELLARVYALIRRSSRESEPTRLEAGDISLDLLCARWCAEETNSIFSRVSLPLLEYLMRNAGRVVSKTMIMNMCGATISTR